MNHPDAVAYCALSGGRLCTVEEVERDCAASAGCEHNVDLIWTSDTEISDDGFASGSARTPTPPDNVVHHDDSCTYANDGECDVPNARTGQMHCPIRSDCSDCQDCETLPPPLDESDQPACGCVFPFNYQGTWYNACTSVNFDRPWCSTIAHTDLARPHSGYKHWNSCAEVCAVGLRTCEDTNEPTCEPPPSSLPAPPPAPPP
eukprot:SAG31_NODE_18009_length_650_cov_0.426497_1_plen_202_part_10